MSSDSPNLPRGGFARKGAAKSPLAEATDKTSTDVDSEAVENFMFEVSAGQAVEHSRTDPPSPAPARLPKSRASKTKVKRLSAQSQGQEPASQISADHNQLSQRTVPRATVARANRRQPQLHKNSRRARMPAWLISSLIHAAILLLLSFYTLAGLNEKNNFGLWASTAPVEEVDEFHEIEIHPSQDWQSLDSQRNAELNDPGAAVFNDSSVASILTDVSGDTALAVDRFGDLDASLIANGKGLADLGLDSGANGTTNFFGVQVQGKRIVYVLDNSGGMQQGQFETLVAELLKSVDSLTPKQQFYVLFYSDTVYPLFYPQPAQDFVRANDRNKQRLRRWLDTVEFCVGNAVDEAVAAAASLRPDAVYLLTDGRLKTTRDGRKLDFLLRSAGRSFPIHTIGLGTRGSRHASAELQQVAEANRGLFREVDVPPAMKQRAQQKNRAYHNKQPGSVWGRNVKPRF